jgi:hypothetical protein
VLQKQSVTKIGSAERREQWCDHIGTAMFHATFSDRIERRPLVNEAEYSKLDAGRRVETRMIRALSARKSDNTVILTLQVGQTTPHCILFLNEPPQLIWHAGVLLLGLSSTA